MIIGETVSHYRIVERLGGGGMGVVYKAMDLRLNRFVALKFLAPALTQDHDANVRFRLEAKAASALDHPNICTIHEIDEDADNRVFLALAFYDGETLKRRIDGGPLPVDMVLDVAIQIAQGLSRAHQSMLVHRDIKPANVMITSAGLVKIVDFGLAKLTGDVDGTRTGTILGTVAYMSPEQARGELVGPPVDVWGLGVVIYEMLAGCRPFTGPDDVAVLSSILSATPTPIGKVRRDTPVALQRVVGRALEKNAAARYDSAAGMLADLIACRDTRSHQSSGRASRLAILRRPIVAIPLTAILVAAAVPAAIAFRRHERVRWAQDEAIPEIRRLAEAEDFSAAFVLAQQAESVLPNDPELTALWPQISATGAFAATDDGANVSMQPYMATDAAWELIGNAPLDHVRLPRGVFRFKIEKEGFEPRLLASRVPGNIVLGPVAAKGPFAMKIPLARKGTAPPDMVPIPGGDFPIGLTGFNSEEHVAIDAFWLDRHEVTNKDFQQFVDASGYTNADLWKDHSFVKDGHRLAREDAVRTFVDSTSHQGPAGWELGKYPADQADYPVTGVSWYEADAYCRAAGKTLPTIFHWGHAAVSPVEIAFPLAPVIVPLSNFGGKGLAAVGRYRGLGPFATEDMAGNAREWVWNEAADGRRWIQGGAWNDPDYMFTVPNTLPPFDRSATNGFRCARYSTPGELPAALMAPVETDTRDNRTAKAVSSEVYEVFKNQYAYVKSPLNARVESRDDKPADWVREVISFDAGYEGGRVTAYLFLPKRTPPPYQLVVNFTGVGAFANGGSSTNVQPPAQFDFIIKNGRAFVIPVFKGSYERWDAFLRLQGAEYRSTFRMRIGQWRQDLARVLDVLASRPEHDIDPGRMAFFGLSFGGSTAFPLVALEDRLKTAILAPGGFTYRKLPPEADALNYASHVTIPVLMIGGQHDFVFPLETSQNPMFDRLGTPARDKKHVVFDSGHINFPRGETIKEILGWLDRYLGPVGDRSAARP